MCIIYVLLFCILRGSEYNATLLKHVIAQSCSTERNENFPLTYVGARIDP